MKSIKRQASSSRGAGSAIQMKGTPGRRTRVQMRYGGGATASPVQRSAAPVQMHGDAAEEAENLAPDVDAATAPGTDTEAQGQGNEAVNDQAQDMAAPNVEGESEKDGPLAKEKAKQVLQDAFGTYTTISEGKVEVLGQAEFQEAYDKIYGATQYSWEKWVKPLHGNLNGFAYNGTNYINKTMANTGTVPHEMLHNNAAADWRPFVGSQFDEGATDVLKQHALQKAGLSSPNSYPNQISCVETFLASGVSKEQLFTAYLKGGADKIVGKHVDDTCAGSWADVKSAMEAKDWAKAKVKLAKKA